MTVPEILNELKSKKKLSRRRLYVYIRTLKIKPLGVRQIPQQYPADTPYRILLRLGLSAGRITVTPKVSTKRR